jgi:hypothetical protein
LKNSERLDYIIDEHLKKEDTSADLRVKVSRKGRGKEDTEYTIDPV